MADGWESAKQSARTKATKPYPRKDAKVVKEAEAVVQPASRSRHVHAKLAVSVMSWVEVAILAAVMAEEEAGVQEETQQAKCALGWHWQAAWKRQRQGSESRADKVAKRRVSQGAAGAKAERERTKQVQKAGRLSPVL